MAAKGGIRKNGFLMEIILWSLIGGLLFAPSGGSLIILCVIPFFNILFTNEKVKLEGKIMVCVFSLGIIFLAALIGDIVRGIVIKRIYTGERPLKYSFLKNFAR